MWTTQYRNTLQEELKEMCDAAKRKDWSEFNSLLDLFDVLYLTFNRAQEVSLETALPASFSLKHAANVRKTFASKHDAPVHASHVLVHSDEHVHETPSMDIKSRVIVTCWC